jgi:hypothetical protein
VVIIVRRLIREGWRDATVGKVVLADSHDLSAEPLNNTQHKNHSFA